MAAAFWSTVAAAGLLFDSAVASPVDVPPAEDATAFALAVA